MTDEFEQQLLQQIEQLARGIYLAVYPSFSWNELPEGGKTRFREAANVLSVGLLAGLEQIHASMQKREVEFAVAVSTAMMDQEAKALRKAVLAVIAEYGSRQANQQEQEKAELGMNSYGAGFSAGEQDACNRLAELIADLA